MKSTKLNDRLALIASLVPDGASVVDVGTDHGYIPVHLALTGKMRRITASDINSGPLSSAVESAEKNGVSDKIEFTLAAGLDAAPDDTDTVIIAGMGGETIINILENALWTRDRGVRLILQPQSKTGDLSNWLDNNGFAINDAFLVKDAGRIYTVLSVSAGASRAPFTCAEMYADRILMEKHDPLLPDLLDALIAKFTHALDGMERSGNTRVDVLEHTRLALSGFKKMKEETELWQL